MALPSLIWQVTTEQFFDPHYLMRNLASLFGIPDGRMRVPDVTSGTSRRRLSGATAKSISIEIDRASACDGVNCGANGYCYEGETSGAQCVCRAGYATPPSCNGAVGCICSAPDCAPDCANCSLGSSECSACAGDLPLLVGGRCVANCTHGQYADPASGTCQACSESCLTCIGGAASDCTSCASFGTAAYLAARPSSKVGTCSLSCPALHFADGARVCQPCHESCATCAGPRSTECTSCVDK
eukprot:3690676-Prymnesium_polylepis.2